MLLSRSKVALKTAQRPVCSNSLITNIHYIILQFHSKIMAFVLLIEKRDRKFYTVDIKLATCINYVNLNLKAGDTHRFTCPAACSLPAHRPLCRQALSIIVLTAVSYASATRADGN